MGLLVRPLELKDAEEVARLHIETWLDTYRGVLPDKTLDALNVKDSTAKWRLILGQSNPNNQFLNIGAYQNGDLAGIASAGPARESWGYDSELLAINIPKRFQKKGVGKALLRVCVDHVLGLKARNMYLYCAIGNDNAMRFYHYLGAVDTTRIEQCDGYQERALVWNHLKALARRLG